MFKCFMCLLLLASIVSGLGGLTLGYKLGVADVCDDVQFYMGADISVRPCTKR